MSAHLDAEHRDTVEQIFNRRRMLTRAGITS
jgi:hypothetical protein